MAAETSSPSNEAGGQSLRAGATSSALQAAPPCDLTAGTTFSAQEAEGQPPSGVSVPPPCSPQGSQLPASLN
jgi:hypothetical protein